MRARLKVILIVAGLAAASGLLIPKPPGVVGTFTYEKFQELSHRFPVLGQDEPIENHPYLAVLGAGYDPNIIPGATDTFSPGCAGTLLDLPGEDDDDQWILTAAHCKEQKHAVFDQANLNEKFTSMKSVRIEKAICHQNYALLAFDIALLSLETEPSFSLKGRGLDISAEPLPITERGIGSGAVTLLGWAHGDRLKKAVVKAGSKSYCSHKLSTVLSTEVFCTYRLHPSAGVTQKRDSGGPALYNGKLAGVIFAGNNPGKPDVHLNLDHFRDWIQGVIENPEQPPNAEIC